MKVCEVHYDLPMAAPILKFPAKELRAEVIVDYVKGAGTYKGIVCITCGHSGDALIASANGECGDIVVIVPEEGDGWISMEQIARDYPGYFDASSGHLPLWLMQRIGDRFKKYFNEYPQTRHSEMRLPTGSGETIIELFMGMDDIEGFSALYDYNRGSKYEAKAPLNNMVSRIVPVHFYESRTRNKE